MMFFPDVCWATNRADQFFLIRFPCIEAVITRIGILVFPSIQSPVFSNIFQFWRETLLLTSNRNMSIFLRFPWHWSLQLHYFSTTYKKPIVESMLYRGFTRTLSPVEMAPETIPFCYFESKTDWFFLIEYYLNRTSKLLHQCLLPVNVVMYGKWGPLIPNIIYPLVAQNAGENT